MSFKVAWSEIYALEVPEGHRFPMEKYDLLPRQLLHEGTIHSDQLFKPDPLSTQTVQLAHDRAYIRKLLELDLSRKEMRAIGLPLSRGLIEREFQIMGGTLQAARFARTDGVAFNVAGGTHHAFADRGEGFCLLNDFAIAALALLKSGEISSGLIVDLDVHQGNGTAEILSNVDDIFTFSFHGASNYPLRKQKSDLDISFRDGTKDHDYLKTLKEILPAVLDKVRPQMVFYLSGVDVLMQDQLGRLSLTLEGCKERDRVVLEAAYSKGIPIVAAMGGGYSKDIKVIVEAHANTFRLAREIWDSYDS